MQIFEAHFIVSALFLPRTIEKVDGKTRRKSAMTPHYIFCSYFPNLRLGSMHLKDVRVASERHNLVTRFLASRCSYETTHIVSRRTRRCKGRVRIVPKRWSVRDAEVVARALVSVPCVGDYAFTVFIRNVCAPNEDFGRQNKVLRVRF
jgi:hypothetical protein